MSHNIITYLLGLDVGTTSIKAVLINSKGKFIASAGKEYSLDSGPDDSCELDPEIYWRVACDVIGEILRKSAVNPALVKGLAISSQGETTIVVGSDGKPLRKAIVWLDNRSRTQAAMIEEKFGNELVMKISGQPEMLPIWPATRILWLREKEPEVFKKIYKILLVEDYMIYRLTGKFYSEQSLVSSSIYYDITAKRWWKEMLDFLRITPDHLPVVIPSGSVVSSLSEAAARETGLTANTTIVSGAYDHPCGAIGAGNIEPGVVSLTIGASMAMVATLNEPLLDLTLKLPCQCHALQGKYFILPYAQTAGMVLRWFRDEMCREEVEEAAGKDIDAYDLIVGKAANINPGADSLIMLPHFMGTGSPQFNSNVKGVFAGLTLGMRKEHFIRAILESVSFTIEQNLEVLKQHGIKIKELRLLGGGAKSPLWCQIIADVTGIPVMTMSQQENASLGAAILAGVGTGVFRNIEQGCNLCVGLKFTFQPDQVKYEVYREIYKKYLELYNSLEGYWSNEHK